jgi:probable rRNA maturation factor
MNIKFFSAGAKINLQEKTRLKLFINELFDKEGFKLASLSYIFCSDKYLLKLNQEFLKHDFYTDILTFDLSSKEVEKTGEIYISVDRVKENAKNLNCAVRSEIHRVIFHGALHLCGYKDKSKIEVARIRAAEDKYLKLYL